MVSNNESLRKEERRGGVCVCVCVGGGAVEELGLGLYFFFFFFSEAVACSSSDTLVGVSPGGPLASLSCISE